MKKNKLAEITIILGIILVILISFIGIYVQNQTKMENKVNEFSIGEELGGYIEVLFDTKEQVTPENIQKSKEIMEKRLEDIGLEEYSIYANNENGNILLQLPKEQDTEYIANCLYQKGVFEIIDTNTKEVLMNNSHVQSSYTLYQTVTGGNAIYMAIEFNEQGKEKLKEISEKYIIKESEETESEKSQTISINLDGNTIISTGFGAPITDGTLYVTVGNATTDTSEMLQYVQQSTQIACAIKNGIMPLSYEIDSNTYISSNIMKNDIITAVNVIGLVTLISLIILIVKYRKIGILASLAYAGCIALYLLVLRYTDSIITLNSICGIIVILILNYVFTLKISKNIKSDDNVADTKEKFKKQFIDFIMLLVPIIILTVVCAFAGLASLGIVLFWGIVTMLVYNYLVTKNLLEVRTKYTTYKE